MRTVFSAIVLTLLATGAAAASLTMTCQNLRGEYQIIFDPENEVLVSRVGESPTAYSVERVQSRNGDGYIVRGHTVADGPDFVAYFGSGARFHFLENGEVVQSDACH